MKVGDYVRTNEFGIQKVKWFDNEEPILENGFTALQSSGYKSSPNIIDLIEVGDLLYVDISPDDCGGIVVPRIPETKFELDILIKKIKCSAKTLKGIITKEQLESMEYKVKE